MALTDKEKRARGGISAFLVDKGTPGFNVLRRIPMIGGQYTYEIALEDCRVPAGSCWAAKARASRRCSCGSRTRRLQMACWSIGMAQRALDMMCEHARAARDLRRAAGGAAGDPVVGGRRGDQDPRRRLMAYDCAWKLDQGRDVRTEISMIKVFATEMA